MKAAPFRYHRAESLAEASAMLADLDNARLLSGGQSLMAMMNLRYVIVDHLIDLNPVREMAGVTSHDSYFEVGAMTRQRCLLNDDAVAAHSPIFRAALSYVGHLQTRNRGTVGGSLAHMDPAAELMGLAALTDAEITLTGPTGARRVAIADFPQGYMTPDIGFDEILTTVRFARWPARLSAFAQTPESLHRAEVRGYACGWAAGTVCWCSASRDARLRAAAQ